jgi:hypothetical protein
MSTDEETRYRRVLVAAFVSVALLAFAVGVLITTWLEG